MPLPVYSSTHFPDLPGQKYRKTPVLTSVRSPLATAGDQRKTVNTLLYRFDLTWSALSGVQHSLIQEAVNMLNGVWGQMFFWEWKRAPYVHSVTSTATDTYTLPAKDVTGLTATVNGVLTACTVSPGTGANGEDQAVFGSATAAGVPVVFSFSGRYLRTVQLISDSFKQVDRAGDLNVWQASVTLIEV